MFLWKVFFAQDLDSVLSEYEVVISDASSAGVDVINKRFTNNWDYIQSCFFALTILTTIGRKYLTWFHENILSLVTIDQVTATLRRRHFTGDFSVCCLESSEYLSCCQCWRMLEASLLEFFSWAGTRTRQGWLCWRENWDFSHLGQLTPSNLCFGDVHD